MAKHLTQVAKHASTVVFENEKIRVIELNVKKGTKFEMHTHPANLVYAVTETVYKETFPEGKPKTQRMKKSEAKWSDGESHAVEFPTAARLLVVELK